MNDQPSIETRIESTYAEAFEMKYTRLIVTAIDRYWLEVAAREFCGYGTSVIGCDVEAGVECYIPASETADGREAVAILAFGFSADSLGQAVVNRTGQCLMTCPTTAVFNGVQSERRVPLGRHLRFFGDGFQKSKKLGERRFWRVPVMDGEFVVEEEVGIAKGIAGGNFIIQLRDQASGLGAAMASVQAIAELPGCITPFPGGVARSGSKVGSRYKNQTASTSETFCPTLSGRVESRLHDDAICSYEIVIDAVDEATIRQSMRVGIDAALNSEQAESVVRISAGNYGGELGKCLVDLESLYSNI